MKKMAKGGEVEPMDKARARNLEELGLPGDMDTGLSRAADFIPGIGFLKKTFQDEVIRQHMADPKPLHNTVGKGLETNYQRNAPFDEFSHQADIQMMSEGGIAGLDGLLANPSPEASQRDTGTAGIDEKTDSVEIPDDIREFIDKAHKEQRESRPDEGWRITPAEKSESVAPYKKDTSALDEQPDVLQRLQSLNMPHYDEGGVVSPFDVDGGATDTLKMNGQGFTPPVPPPPPPMAAPNVPRETIPAAPAAVAPAPPIPAAAAPADPNYMARANKILGLDAGQSASFMKMLGDNSQKAQLGAGLAGIGDAIASGGTLGKVNPGALHTSEDLIQNRTKEGLEGMQTLRANQKENFELGQTLRGNEPFSPEIQKSLVKQFHIPQALSGAPRDVIYKMLDPIAQTQLKEAELAAANSYKTQALDLQKKQLEATVANQKAERAATQEQHQIEATKTLADRGLVKRGLDALTGNPATKALEHISAGQPPSFSTETEAEAAKLAPGTVVMIGGRRARVK